MTFLEKLREEYPERANADAMSLTRDCPYKYGYEGMKNSVQHCFNGGCDYCWSREIPETKSTKNEREELEMEPRNISFTPTATAAGEPKKQSICDNMSELRKTLTDIDCKMEELYRLLFGGECSETLHPTPSCLEEDVYLVKELARAIMNKLCSIQEKL